MRKKNTMTAGKTASIPSYRRGQLVKFGIKSYQDMVRVLNPEGHPFTFQTEGFPVKVEPAKDVLPHEAFEELIAFTRVFPILMGQCHTNAFRVAQLLQSYGVLYCDGFYTNADGETNLHSFCKYGERYFDPTVEFGLYSCGIYGYSYYSSRTFVANEILIYFATTTLMSFHLVGKTECSPSSLDYDFQEDDDTRFCYMIDDDGYLRWVDNPYYATCSR